MSDKTIFLINNWRNKFTNRFTPLQQLLIIGSIFRLVAVIFSKGFSWSDDHFLIIETSASWADGHFNFWLPTEQEPNREPQGHALFYIGLHYYFFKFTNLIGLHNPQTKMYIIRFIHALWSLLLIKYGYKIAYQYKGKKAAWYVGLFLALFWFMPFLSVRNLVEYVCVPLILMAIYYVNKPNSKKTDYLLAGLSLGFAFSIRFQSILITAGIILALILLHTDWRKVFYLILAFLSVVLLTQGLVDIIIWKKPFTEFLAYVEYNLNNATIYGTDNWHMYFDLIFGMLIPPLSIVLVIGFFYSYKKTSLIFWSVFIYLVFHIYFPNKQERFVVTVLPLIIISGTVGAIELYERYGHKIKPQLIKASTIFVVSLNILALAIFTIAYGKRHRVEAMYYLYQKGIKSNVWYEDSNREEGCLIPPFYYLGNWQFMVGINNKEFPVDSALKLYNQRIPEERPEYVVFWQSKNIDKRVGEFKKRFPGLIYETKIEAGLVDKMIYFFNPENQNEDSYIYRIESK